MTDSNTGIGAEAESDIDRHKDRQRQTQFADNSAIMSRIISHFVITNQFYTQKPNYIYRRLRANTNIIEIIPLIRVKWLCNIRDNE